MLNPSLLAHPLADLQALPASSLAVTTAAVSLVLIAYARPRRAVDDARLAVHPPVVGARRIRTVGRAAVGLLVIVAVAAGLTGSASPTRNLAPGLLVGIGWPLLLLGSVAAGRRAANDAQPAGHVHPAALTALLAVWYLAVQPDRLHPRVVVGFLAAYLVLTVGGCVLAGGRSWLQRGEAIGLLLSWTSRLRGGRLATWVPPPGANVVLGIFAGGFLFGLWHGTDPWMLLVQRHPAAGIATLIAAVGGVTALLVLAERRATRGGGGGAVAAASVPLVAGLALAHAVDRGVLSAVQLMPHVLADPLGRGWQLLPLERVSHLPLAVDPVVVLAVQLVLIVAGGVAAAHTVRARVGPAPGGRATAVGSTALVVAAGVLAVANQSVRTIS